MKDEQRTKSKKTVFQNTLGKENKTTFKQLFSQPLQISGCTVQTAFPRFKLESCDE
jgi:hypothetical protein